MVIDNLKTGCCMKEQCTHAIQWIRYVFPLLLIWITRLSQSRDKIFCPLHVASCVSSVHPQIRANIASTVSLRLLLIQQVFHVERNFVADWTTWRAGSIATTGGLWGVRRSSSSVQKGRRGCGDGSSVATQDMWLVSLFVWGTDLQIGYIHIISNNLCILWCTVVDLQVLWIHWSLQLRPRSRPDRVELLRPIHLRED